MNFANLYVLLQHMEANKDARASFFSEFSQREVLGLPIATDSKDAEILKLYVKAGKIAEALLCYYDDMYQMEPDPKKVKK